MLTPETVVLIAGPTASGKSQFALGMAKIYQGEIVNADSMQIYKDIPLLTAAPSASDYAQCPHHLYQFLPSTHSFSVAAWQNRAYDICQDIINRRKIPLVVGGTGLYLKAFEYGLSSLPDIDPLVREELMNTLHHKGLPFLYDELHHLDPLGASRLNPGDTQRILRALEVMKGTKKPLHQWHKENAHPPCPFPLKKILLNDTRDLLTHKAAQRWHTIKHQGVIEDVKNLLEKDSLFFKTKGQHLPLLKAVGVSAIQHYLSDSSINLDERIIQHTRRYIKRQQTWLKHQFKADIHLKSSAPIPSFE